MAQESVSGTDDFAERLSLALRAANLSGAQLSAAVGVDKSVVSRWLSGHVQPTNYNLARISAALAKALSGFNMTLWTAPRAQFEAALGLSHPAGSLAAAAEPLIPADGAHVLESWRNIAIGTALLLILAVAGWFVWSHRETVTPRPAEQVVAASVAVMPFVNMSGDPAKEYLGDGISEEILNDLANTANLRVAARTSSFSFKGTHPDILEIAKKLKVRTVLEGSVRQEGDRVRIVAQLIDAEDGFHLWSARYDRQLHDILAVQDEIARAIVRALTLKLLPGRTPILVSHVPARINPDAYTAYLQGRYAMNRSNAEDFQRAAELFQQAIRLQTDFASAHAGLALADVILFSNGERRDTLDPARKEIAATLQLDPANFTAQLADAQVKALAWNWAEAYSTIQKLLRQYPREPDVHLVYAFFLQTVGLWEKSIGELRRAADLDPLVPAYRENVGWALHVLQRDKDAASEYKQVLALDPNFLWALADLCPNYANAGRMREAKQILRERLTPKYAEDRTTIYCASVIAYRERNRLELQRLSQLSERLYARNAMGAAWVVFPYAFMGDYAGAMRWLEKAYDDRDSNVFYAVLEPDLPAGLKQTARWRTFMQRPDFQEIARVRAQILARGG